MDPQDKQKLLAFQSHYVNQVALVASQIADLLRSRNMLTQAQVAEIRTQVS